MSDLIQNWFNTALLHDIGKILLDRSGQWTRHNELRRWSAQDAAGKELFKDYPTLAKNPPDFVALLGDTLVDQIASQHDVDAFDNTTPEKNAAIATHIADEVHKAMHAMIDEKGNSLEHDPRLSHLQASPSFYPYYGQAVKGISKKGKVIGWAEPQVAGELVPKVVEILREGHNLKHLLDLQGALLHFPHTSYIPHISLGLHQRFSGAIFYLAFRQLESLRKANRPSTDLETLNFYLITIAPDPLGAFYRLRNIQAFTQAVEDLRSHLFDAVF
jgi:hypothetical protein